VLASPHSLSLESVLSSPLSPATDTGSRLEAFSPGSNRLAPSHHRHERYYFSDGNVIFLVEGVLYNIHRYFFQRDSSNFASMFSIPFGGRGQGLTDDEPISLVNIKAQDFDLFLSILYPTEFGVFCACTVDEWAAVLYLADKWNFKSIKNLAINKLALIASPIDRIVLGRNYQINEWLGDAYRDVCTRADPLTYEEGVRLGMEDVINISAIMVRYDYAPRFSRRLLDEELESHFGLEKGVHQLAHGSRNVEDHVQEPVELEAAEGPVEQREMAPVVSPVENHGVPFQSENMNLDRVVEIVHAEKQVEDKHLTQTVPLPIQRIKGKNKRKSVQIP